MKERGYSFLFVVFFSTVMSVVAQSGKYGKTSEDSIKCREYLSLYSENYKKKNYEEVYKYWDWAVKNCPASTKNLYIHSEKIIGYKMKKAKGKDAKKPWVERLLSLYDQRNQYFPGKEAYLKGKKAIARQKYKYGSLEDTYALFRQVLETSKEKTDLPVLYGMFRIVKELYKEKVGPISKDLKSKTKEAQKLSGKRADLLKKRKTARRDKLDKIDADLKAISNQIKKVNDELKGFKDQKNEAISILFDVYDQVYPIIETSLELYPKTLSELEAKPNPTSKDKKKIAGLKKRMKNYKKVKASIDKLLAPLATCDRLDKIYTAQYDKRRGDVRWLQKVTKILTQKRCYDLKVYAQVVEDNFQKDPKAGSARTIAILAKKNKKDDKALEYYVKAAEMETDAYKKAKDYFNIAKIYNLKKKKTKARDYARKAIKENPTWGAPIILIGNLYAASANQCGKNGFQKKAVYWVALNEYLNAMVADPSEENQKEAKKLIKAYVPLAPDKSLTFAHGYTEKKTYTVKCWIQKTIKIDRVSKL